jgi:hypothetical protein
LAHSEALQQASVPERVSLSLLEGRKETIIVCAMSISFFEA